MNTNEEYGKLEQLVVSVKMTILFLRHHTKNDVERAELNSIHKKLEEISLSIDNIVSTCSHLKDSKT